MPILAEGRESGIRGWFFSMKIRGASF